MKIQIDTDILIEEALEPQQYVWLYMQYVGDINNSWLVSPIFPTDLDYLEKQHFIKITGSGSEPIVVLRNRTLDLFEVEDVDSKFNTFWGMFPIKVPNGSGGYRVLRAKEIGTKDYDEAKKKYISLIRNSPGLHEKIIKGLQNQLITERNKLQFMNNIITWLNQRVWERFYDLDISEGNVDEERL